MKTNLVKQIGLFSMLVLFFNLADTQPQNELLLPYILPDSVAIKTAFNNNVPAIVPLQVHFREYVDHFLDENSETLEKIMERNSAKFRTIQNILVKRGIPAGLVYLAIVESQLMNSAISRAGAVGIWQLMPETARTFGLQVNGKTDERRHTYRSSVAAAKYLTALYKQFDDWLLVVAAYNCGAGNVYKAIKQSGSREFWKLQRFLPAESRSHVRHFIATHYYYEKAGSVVTLTKKERIGYLASLNQMALKADDPKPSGTPGGTPVPYNQPSPATMLTSQEDVLICDWRK